MTITVICKSDAAPVTAISDRKPSESRRTSKRHSANRIGNGIESVEATESVSDYAASVRAKAALPTSNRRPIDE